MAEVTTVLDIDPQELKREAGHIFEMGWYEGELTDLAIVTTTEATQYKQVGDRSFHIKASLNTSDGFKDFDSWFDMQGKRAFAAGLVFKSLGATRGTDLNLYKGAKVRIQFDKPFKGEKATYNQFVQLQIVE